MSDQKQQQAPERIGWSGKSFNYTQAELDVIVQTASSADPLTKGGHLKAFEEKFGAYIGGGPAFGVTSGAAALELIALLSGVKAGDEVILPAHTYCASGIPFGRAGAKLVWADIDPEALVMDPAHVEKLITPNTKLILAVHLYGRPCDMERLRQIADKHNIILAEDCAQALGAKFKGKRVGSLGDFAAFSFHAQKNMTLMGEGGAIVVNHEESVKQVFGMRHNGHRPWPEGREHYWEPAMVNVDEYLPGVWPYNFPLTEVQAALGVKVLDRLDQLNAERTARGRQFIKAMADFDELKFQSEPADGDHVFHLLPARVTLKSGKHRNELIQMLHQQYGIKTIIQYYPLYRYDLFKKMGFGAADCPETDEFYDNMISFPFHHWMSDEDFQYMIDSTKAALTELRKS
ncbi:MAG: DegT/DnrJ/EryC1/StrS family aminotransferase [bacterium]|nr:DegT/DnrJ/EryC1/StrS family aminotransferase [bacterium]